MGSEQDEHLRVSRPLEVVDAVDVCRIQDKPRTFAASNVVDLEPMDLIGLDTRFKAKNDLWNYMFRQVRVAVQPPIVRRIL